MKIVVASNKDPNFAIENLASQINQVNFATIEDLPTETSDGWEEWSPIYEGALWTGALTGANLTTIAEVADRLEMGVVYAPKRFYVNTASFYCAAITSTPNARMVIYDSDDRGLPNNLIYESSSIALSVGAFSEACNLFLEARRPYWTGIHSSGVATFRALDGLYIRQLGLQSLTSVNFFGKLRLSQTYASGAPRIWDFSNSQRALGVPPSLFLTVGTPP